MPACDVDGATRHMNRVMKFLKALFAWLAATAVAAAAGSVVQTQFNLGAIAALGAPVPWDARLATTLQDLAGFAPVYGAIVGAAFLVAFLLAALLARAWGQGRILLYVSAGAASIVVAILLMNLLLPVVGIGATRWASGIAALGATGGLGGWTFASLTRRRHPDMAWRR